MEGDNSNSNVNSNPNSGARACSVEQKNPLASPTRGMGCPRSAPGSPLNNMWFSPRRDRVTYSDRFIPSRAATSRLDFSILDRELAAEQVSKSVSEREDVNPAYNMLLRSELLGYQCPSPMSPDKGAQVDQLKGSCSPAKKLFRFKSGDIHSPVAGPPPQSPFSSSLVGSEGPLGSPLLSPCKPSRKIARAPFKVLDAPSLADDFYLNLVDWSSQNVLAVALGSCVYLWSACTSKVDKLCDLGMHDSVCSVAWSQRGTFLSVGTNQGTVQIWNVAEMKKTRTMEGHKARVGTLAWSSYMLSTGSRDRCILQRDVRAPDHYTHKLTGHKSEVCGLKWSPDDRQLASGGNDNQLMIWSVHNNNSQHTFKEHTAAVKAISWSPHQHGLLASGGGTADRCIRFWNTSTNTALNCIDTGSQVCNLAWAKNVNELVSTHGYSQNQVIVWKYPSMSKLATLTGHTFRVLYLASSPDGQTIVTGAGDETLRFWNVFPGPKTQGQSHDISVNNMMRTQIR